MLEDIELAGPLGGERLELCFNGPFEGRRVTWQATLYTLQGWLAEHPELDSARNFITIECNGESDETPRLVVGLALHQIDRTAVLNAVRMIRQYKRLQRGHHEYGPEVQREEG